MKIEKNTHDDNICFTDTIEYLKMRERQIQFVIDNTKRQFQLFGMHQELKEVQAKIKEMENSGQ